MLCAFLTLLVLGGTGCAAKSTENKTFPENYHISGVDVGGMNETEAKKALTDAVADYSAIVTMNTYEITLGEDALNLTYDDSLDLTKLLKEAEPGQDIQVSVAKADIDANALQTALSEAYYEALSERVSTEGQAEESESEDGKKKKDKESKKEKSEAEIALSACLVSNRPYIKYDSKKHAFKACNGKACDILDYTSAAEAFCKQAAQLTTAINLTTETVSAPALKAADYPNVAEGVKNANALLDLHLGVYFSPEGYIPVGIDFDKDTIASWLTVSRTGDEVIVSEDALSEFCSNLAQEHNRTKKSDRIFKTTLGDEISIDAPVDGIVVDASVFYDGLKEAIENKKDATIDAVYHTVEDNSTNGIVDFKGNYCEVDLTNQHVYVYKDYKLVVDTDVVTGCVANGGTTPEGVYQIFTHDKGRYLNGPTWHVWVHYFCAFNGGIGFHDTTYRSNFGGSIYLYGGSHGCINMPLEAAEALYNNVEIGTYVVCHGGVKYVDKLQQTWSGTASYTVKEGSKAFALDADTTGNADAPLTYKSSDKKVATVSADGVVTPKKAGTCTITVHAAEFDKYAASDFEVTIHVQEDPKKKQDDKKDKDKDKPKLKEAKITVSTDYTLAPGESTVISASVNSGAAVTYTIGTPSQSWLHVGTDGSVSIDADAPPGETATVSITIKSAATNKYKAATTTVTITVTVQEVIP